jgi:hypothetical protein
MIRHCLASSGGRGWGQGRGHSPEDGVYGVYGVVSAECTIHYAHQRVHSLYTTHTRGALTASWVLGRGRCDGCMAHTN